MTIPELLQLAWLTNKLKAEPAEAVGCEGPEPGEMGECQTAHCPLCMNGMWCMWEMLDKLHAWADAELWLRGEAP